MRKIQQITCGIIWLAVPIITWSQGTVQFQNLNFESATIVPISGSVVQFGPAFPGWVGYIASNSVSGTLYNNLGIGSSQIALLDANSPGSISNYTAVLQGGSASF